MFHVAPTQSVKNLPAMQETQVQVLGQEDPLEKEMANPLQFSCRGDPMDRGASRATVHRVARVGHDLATASPPLTSKLLPRPVRAAHCGPQLSDLSTRHPHPCSFWSQHLCFSSPGPLCLLFIPMARGSSLLPVTLQKGLPRSACLKQTVSLTLFHFFPTCIPIKISIY